MRALRCVLLSMTMGAALCVGGAMAQSTGGIDPSQVTPGLGGGAAVVVNGEVITNFDVQQRAMLVAMMAGIQVSDQNRTQLMQQAARSLVDERLEIQSLRKMEREQKFQIVAEDDEVNASIDEIAKENNVTPDEFRARLAASGLDIQTLREQIRAQTSWQRMINGRYASRIKISDRQVDQALQRASATAAQSQYQVSEIYLDAARVGGMAEAVEGARQLIAQMQQQKAPFSAVARQFSTASTAASGGDMGWVTPTDLAPEVSQAVAQLQPGQVSEPIQTSDGVYIVMLRNKRSGQATTMVSLKQAAVALAADAPEDQVAAATQKLQGLIASGPTCDNLITKAGADSAIVANDLGETDLSTLSPEINAGVASLEVGQMSAPVRSPVGLHAFLVCGKRTANANTPTRQAIERRLMADQLTMLSRRTLRDLRATATIEQPQS